MKRWASPYSYLRTTLLGFGVFFIPIIFVWWLLKPGFSKRARQAGFGWFALTALVWVLAMLTPDTPRVDTDNVQGSTTAAAPAPPPVRRDMKAEVAGLWGWINEHSAGCDHAADKIVAAMKTGNPYEVYPAAKEGAALCSAASDVVAKGTPPSGISDDASAAFGTAITSCSEQLAARASAYDQIVAVTDGDQRPSAIMEAKDRLETANAGAVQCAISIMQAANKVGVSPDFFGKH